MNNSRPYYVIWRDCKWEGLAIRRRIVNMRVLFVVVVLLLATSINIVMPNTQVFVS